MLLSLHSSSSAMMPDGSAVGEGEKSVWNSQQSRLFLASSSSCLSLSSSPSTHSKASRDISREWVRWRILRWNDLPLPTPNIWKWCGDLSRLESAQLNSHSLVLFMRALFLSAVTTNSTVFPDSFLLLEHTKRCSFSSKKSSMCWRKICRFPEESRQLPSMALLCWELAEMGRKRERERKTLDNIRSSSNDSTQVVDCSWRCSWVEICVWHSKKIKSSSIGIGSNSSQESWRAVSSVRRERETRRRAICVCGGRWKHHNNKIQENTLISWK